MPQAEQRSPAGRIGDRSLGGPGERDHGATRRMSDQPLWLTFIVAFIIMNVLLIGMAYMTLFERKVLAAMQDRMGPTRTGPKGILQPIADGIKLLGKEDLIPRAA